MANDVEQSTSALGTILQSFNSQLKNELTWLDNAFGPAERIIKSINGRSYKLPAIYLPERPGSNDYRMLAPDDKLGNYSFFWLMDPKRYEWVPRMQGRNKAPFALIFWVDLRKVRKTNGVRDLLDLEEKTLKVIKEITPPAGALRIANIYRLPENIFREFTLDETINQFLMHPYGGFRFEGELIYDEPC